MLRNIIFKNTQKNIPRITNVVAPNLSNISEKMPVMEFALFSVMLRASSTLLIFGNFARLLLLCKQSRIVYYHSMKPMNGKKIVGLSIHFHHKREVYYERTV